MSNLKQAGMCVVLALVLTVSMAGAASMLSKTEVSQQGAALAAQAAGAFYTFVTTVHP